MACPQCWQCAARINQLETALAECTAERDALREEVAELRRCSSGAAPQAGDGAEQRQGASGCTPAAAAAAAARGESPAPFYSCSNNGGADDGLECVDLSASLDIARYAADEAAPPVRSAPAPASAELDPRRWWERELLLWAAARARTGLRQLPAELLQQYVAESHLRTGGWPVPARWELQDAEARGDRIDCVCADGLRADRITGVARCSVPVTVPGARRLVLRTECGCCAARPPRYVGLADRGLAIAELGQWEDSADGRALYYDAHNGGLFGGTRWTYLHYGGLPHISDGANGGEMIVEYEPDPPALLLRWPRAVRRRGIITVSPVGSVAQEVDPAWGRGHRHLLSPELRCATADVRWILVFVRPGDAMFVTPE
eukprot:TRINITY_DN608_c0_g2_i2.p1 TRINITY_DN608_c0_g2~~TRINITY_DN608_c0_g2_i2.p1  ORF type:complete len:396 (+),score=80.92 TRINITY_DN608_c0_g2_i2:68-1189(+)